MNAKYVNFYLILKNLRRMNRVNSILTLHAHPAFMNGPILKDSNSRTRSPPGFSNLVFHHLRGISNPSMQSLPSKSKNHPKSFPGRGVLHGTYFDTHNHLGQTLLKIKFLFNY